MFNAGVRGKRAKDSTGLITVGEHFNQQQFLIPTVTRFAVTDGSYVDTDDIAADTTGGQTIVLYGSGFAPGATVLVGSTTIGAVTFLDSGRLTFSSPALGSGSYTVFVTNANGGTGILVPGLVYSGLPTFTTAAGSLGSVYETTAINTTVVATGDAPITYALASGSLPSGSTLSSGGTISGTAPVDGSSTTYSFTVRATDADNQDSVRSFSLTINTDVVSFSSPANNTTTTATQNSAISNVTVTATSAAGYGVLYTSTGLPTGLSMNTSTGIISGTPTVVASNTSIITATANTTSRTAALYLNWTINLPGDAFWKYASLLMSASTVPNGNTFNADASTINNEVIVVADTKPSEFHPFKEGYYSNYFDGTGDYLQITANTNIDLSGDFTIESWVYATGTRSTSAVIAGRWISGATIWLLAYDNVNKWALAVNGSNLITYNSTIIYNTWYHIAITRLGTSVTMWLNGVSVGTGTSSFSLTSATRPLLIGRNGDSTDGSQDWLGYISNFRIVKGTALYTAGFTPPTGPLTYVANTTLLTCQSNKLIDNSNNNFTITKNGDVTVNPFSPFNGTATTVTVPAANNYSLYFDGTGDYLSFSSNSAFGFGTGDFTVEYWVYSISWSTAPTVVDLRTPSGSSLQWSDNFSTGGAPGMYYNATQVLTSSITIPLRTWAHVAYTREGSTVKVWVNGVQGATGTSSFNLQSSGGFSIGTNNGNANPFNGYVSNIRILKGTALYTTTFTPPVGPLTVIANTSLLTAQANTIIDNSNNQISFTVNGDARPARNGPFANTSTVTLIGSEGSTYFDGTGDYLSMSAVGNPLDWPASANYTIEAWVYLNAFTATESSCILARRNPTATTTDWQFQISTAGALVLYNLNGSTTITATSNMAIKQWNHCAAVISGGTATLYLNGAKVSTATAISAASTASISTYIVGASNSVYLNGYISNLRVVKGTALYTKPFVPTWSPLTPIANTVLLTAQTNTSSNTKVMVDESNFAGVVSGFGNTNLGTFSPSGSSWSVVFDGTNDYIAMPTSSSFNFGTGDFTVECWVYWNSTAINQGMISRYASASSGWALRYDASGLNWINGDTSIVAAAHTPVGGTWYHYAACRSGSTLRLFINGTQSASVTYSGNQDNSSSLYIGQLTNTLWPVNGYISNVRILKGTALYTSAFTPSTTPLLPVANTVLLTCNSNQYVDYSAANNYITRTGDAAVAKFSPFSSVTVTPASYSGYFNSLSSTTTYPSINVSTSSTFNLYPVDSTVECWFILNAYGNGSNPTAVSTLFSFYSGSAATYYGVKVTNNGFLMIAKDGGGSASITSTTFIGLNTWYHFAWVHTAGGTTNKFYLNGVDVTSTFSDPSLAGAFPLNPATSTLYIGGTYYNNNPYTYIDPWNGCISNFRIVRGTKVYTGNFTVPTTPLGLSQSASANTVVLGIPANGNSVFFDGTGDYLSVPSDTNLAFGTGDFTVEAWVNWSSVASPRPIIDMQSSGSFNLYWDSGAFNANSIVVSNRIANQIIYSFVPVVGTWYHIAVARSGTNLRLFVNGTLVSTAAGDSTNYGAGISHLGGDSGAGWYHNGYISNLRAVKGTAVYTSTFTPPTEPLTAIANTVLLTCQNSTPSNTRIIIDSSTNSFPISSVGDTVISRIVSPFGNTAALLTCQSTSFVDTSNSAFAITVNGDAKPVIQNPFTNTISAASNYSANTFGNSIYFDGTTDYLTIPYNPSFNIPASTPFTCEAWVYQPSSTEFHVLNRNWAYGSTGSTYGFGIGNDMKPFWSIGGTGASTYNMLSAGTAGKPGQWNHFAWSRDASNVCRVFTNGVETVSVTRTDSQAMSTTSGSAFVGVTSNLASPYASGYLSNLRFIVGSCLYNRNFVPSNQPLPVTSNTSILLASTVGPSTADATRNHNIETFGTARRVANNSPYYDTYSAYFDGTGDYLTFGANQANLGLGTGDFTFEFWFNALTIPAGEIDIFESQTNNSFRILKRASSSGLSFDPYGGTATLIMADASITTNTWHHVAVSRTSGTTSAYYDGTRVVNQADSTNYAAPVANYGVGGRASGANYLTGYISNMRLIKGTGLYSGTTITVPTSPLTAVANTQLLICNNNRFIDGSTNAFTITKAGDAKITAFEPFDSSNNSRFNSIYFGTKTDYLAIRQQANLKIFPGDFTFECWVYPTDTTISTAWTIWDARQTGASAAAMTFGLGALASPVTGSWRMAYFNGTNYYGTGTILWNQWTHVAWVRSGTTMTFYVNGVASGTATVSGTQTATATTNPIYIGTKDNGLAGYGTVGYIADFRITNGYARTITVPTAPYDIK